MRACVRACDYACVYACVGAWVHLCGVYLCAWVHVSCFSDKPAMVLIHKSWCSACKGKQHQITDLRSYFSLFVVIDYGACVRACVCEHVWTSGFVLAVILVPMCSGVLLLSDVCSL